MQDYEGLITLTLLAILFVSWLVYRHQQFKIDAATTYTINFDDFNAVTTDVTRNSQYASPTDDLTLLTRYFKTMNTPHRNELFLNFTRSLIYSGLYWNDIAYYVSKIDYRTRDEADTITAALAKPVIVLHLKYANPQDDDPDSQIGNLAESSQTGNSKATEAVQLVTNNYYGHIEHIEYSVTAQFTNLNIEYQNITKKTFYPQTIYRCLQTL